MEERRGAAPDNLELESFYRQLVMLVDTGLPTPAGIRRFGREVRNPRFRNSLKRMAEGLEQGETLSRVMLKEKMYFPPEIIALIRAGEQGGSLVETLQLAMDHELFQIDLRNRIRKSLYYPIVVFLLVCAAYSIILLVSYPVFLDIYRKSGVQLPWISELGYNLFQWVLSHGYYLGALFLGALMLFRMKRARSALHALWLKVPILKTVFLERFITSFSQGMSILLKTGISISASIGFMASVTGNSKLASLLERAAVSSGEGASLSSVLKAADLFPVLYTNAISAAEKSGDLAGPLRELAGIYRTEAEFHAGLFIRLLDTTMIILAALWVLFLLIGIYSLHWGFFEAFEKSMIW